jgi:hypothetical protein
MMTLCLSVFDLRLRLCRGWTRGCIFIVIFR